MSKNEPVCFTCGLVVASSPFANRLADGRACPTCRDRLLDEAPALLPCYEVREAEELVADTLEVGAESENESGDDDPIGA